MQRKKTILIVFGIAFIYAAFAKKKKSRGSIIIPPVEELITYTMSAGSVLYKDALLKDGLKAFRGGEIVRLIKNGDYGSTKYVNYNFGNKDNPTVLTGYIKTIDIRK